PKPAFDRIHPSGTPITIRATPTQIPISHSMKRDTVNKVKPISIEITAVHAAGEWPWWSTSSVITLLEMANRTQLVYRKFFYLHGYARAKHPLRNRLRIRPNYFETPMVTLHGHTWLEAGASDALLQRARVQTARQVDKK